MRNSQRILIIHGSSCIYSYSCGQNVSWHESVWPIVIWPKMAQLLTVGAKGPLPSATVAVAQASGEILWPVVPIYACAYPEASRHFLKALHKSNASVRAVYLEVFGTQAPPELAVSWFAQWVWSVSSRF